MGFNSGFKGLTLVDFQLDAQNSYLFILYLFIYIQRMDTNRIPKQALQYKPKGRRHVGRPRKRWRDQLHFEDTRNRNQT